jgi:hypothetical protein
MPGPVVACLYVFVFNALDVFEEGKNRTKDTMDNGTRELRLFELENGPLIHVEVNMEELPLFLFKSRDRVEESLEVRNTILTTNGQRLQQYVKVTGGREFGLPGPADRDVYVATMRHVHQRGGMPPDGRVSFTIYGLLRLMGKNPKAGKNHERVRESLHRIATTDIYAENAFYNMEGEVFESQRFSPWRVTFRRVKHRGNRAERHTLKFDEVLVRSYNANYLKSLDSDFYFSLHNSLAKTLYGLVDVRRKGTLRWTVEIQQLRQLIPLPGIYYQPSKIKERLDAAHRELVRCGFLTRVDFEERRDGVHLVHYGISARFVRERTAATSDLSPRDLTVVESLIETGMWPEVARKLVREQGPDHLLTLLEALPYQQGIENPPAWIRRYAENNWPVPLPGLHGADANSSRPAFPGPEPSRDLIARQVKARLKAGEFDKTIQDFENLSYEDYKTFVGASRPIADALGNRFYLSLDGDLYLYVGGVEEHNRFRIHTLQRALDD